MKTITLNITESEINDLCEHGQIILSDEIQDDCNSCSEPYEIEIMLRVTKGQNDIPMGEEQYFHS